MKYFLSKFVDWCYYKRMRLDIRLMSITNFNKKYPALFEEIT